MIKTDKPGILKTADGCLINVETDDYETQRARAISAARQTEKINMLEDRVSNMENMLRLILEKVS